MAEGVGFPFGACEEGMLRYVRPPQNDEKSALR